MTRAVRIFVASSSENLRVAHALCSVLGKVRASAFNIVPAAWDRGTFKLSAAYIESLEEEMSRADFSVLILTPNDVTRIRDEEVLTPRDNVLFELGLFMGRLGRARCYMVHERGNAPKLPADLLGIEAATYEASPTLAGLKSALQPACRKIVGRASEIFQGQRLGAFISQIEGPWWERIQTKSGFELSFFRIVPDDRYTTVHLGGDHYDGQGEPIGDWRSVVVRIQEDQKKLFYHWEGKHPPTSEGHASRVQGFGTFEFDPARGELTRGKGEFMDVDPAAIGRTAQWKTIRLRRVTDWKRAGTMTDGSLARRRTLVKKILRDW